MSTNKFTEKSLEKGLVIDILFWVGEGGVGQKEWVKIKKGIPNII